MLLSLAVAAGVAGAMQGLVNGALAGRLGSPFDAAVVNNTVGMTALLLAVAFSASLRRGVRALLRTRLPWWTYLGGMIGAAFVSTAAYAVPILGVSVFAIAQICGVAVGALFVDRTRIGPAGPLPLSPARLIGAGLGLGAVVISQVGRPTGEVAIGVVLLAVAVSAATAVQVALNSRITMATGSPGAATVLNFAIGLPTILAVAGMLGAAPRHGLPGSWWLYLGGLCGVFIVVATVLVVPVIGVLRTSLAMTAGQLGSSLLIDGLVAGRHHLTVWLVLGSMLTVAAVRVANGRTPARTSRHPKLPAPRSGGTGWYPGGGPQSRPVGAPGRPAAGDGRLGEREH